MRIIVDQINGFDNGRQKFMKHKLNKQLHPTNNKDNNATHNEYNLIN